MLTSPPEKVGMSSVLINRINDLTSSHIENGGFAGTVTLVARRNQVVHLQSSGKMSLETGQPMCDDTIFRIYSMTKPVTSIAVMMLYERGHFQLDTPVSKFIPEFKYVEVFDNGTADNYKTIKPLREINIRDLLTHTSGLTYGMFAPTIVDELYRKAGINTDHNEDTLEMLVHKITQMPLLFSPGTKWNYGMSDEVLGRMIEIISGQPFDVFLKREIFDPLGMIDTGFYVPTEKQDRFATNYMRRSIVNKKDQDVFPDQKFLKLDDPITGHYSRPPLKLLGGQGLVSTASDYLKFAKMLLNKGRMDKGFLVNPNTIDLMTKNHLEGDLATCCMDELNFFQLPGIGYGLGVGVILDAAKANLHGTPGTFYWSGVAHTSFFVDPKEELIGIFLTQTMGSDLKDNLKQFRTAVYEAIID